MGDKFTPISPDLYEYLAAHRTRDDRIGGHLDDLIEETSALPMAMMQIAPEQGNLLAMLVRLTGARSCVEIGTFTGYSAVCIASALPEDGELLCCDVSEEWTAIARKYFARTGLDDRIELVIAPALETLEARASDAPVDFAFVDADKTSYRAYYEALLPRLRPGGLIVFDNVLWGGSVINAEDESDNTTALRELNDFLPTDPRVECVMISVSDGLMLVRKRDGS